jgi:SAM-dependent methyltransferase
LGRAEHEAVSGNLDATLDVLRGLSLDDFGLVLLAMPDAGYPALSRLLPKMADEQVQRDWTGNAGFPLLAQSLNFVRSVALKYQQATGTSLREASILDFGCGYGRLLRLMAFYAPPSRIWGVDPWDRSIEICRADRMPMHLAVSDYLPRSLPVGEARFELIYAFSVFTHLSRRTTLMALATLRQHVVADGLLVITTRPREYWGVAAASGQSVDGAIDVAARMREHEEEGFTFIPHDRAPIEGEVTYGDTSMTLDWLSRHAEGWRVDGYDHTLDDFHQLIIYLRPV